MATSSLELDQYRSRDILQASRDGLQESFQRELEQFTHELSMDRKAALRQRERKFSTFSGSDTFSSRTKAEAQHRAAGPS